MEGDSWKSQFLTAQSDFLSVSELGALLIRAAGCTLNLGVTTFFFYHASFVLHAMSQLLYRGRWTSGPKPKIGAKKGTLHCRQDGARTHLQSFKVKGTLLWGRFLLFADNEEGRGLGYQEAEKDEVFNFQGEGSQHCAP